MTYINAICTISGGERSPERTSLCGGGVFPAIREMYREMSLAGVEVKPEHNKNIDGSGAIQGYPVNPGPGRIDGVTGPG